MSGWLLDTNVISELRRPRPERKLLDFVAAQPIERLYISVVSFAEIRFGIELISDATHRAELHDWLALRVRPMFQQRALSISEDVMLRWRLLVEEGRKIRHIFSQPDLIIAATALQHDLVIVTRNESDYRLAKVSIFNPWREG